MHCPKSRLACTACSAWTRLQLYKAMRMADNDKRDVYAGQMSELTCSMIS